MKKSRTQIQKIKAGGNVGDSYNLSDCTITINEGPTEKVIELIIKPYKERIEYLEKQIKK